MIQYGDFILNWSRSVKRESRSVLAQVTELSNRSRKILAELHLTTGKRQRGEMPKP